MKIAIKKFKKEKLSAIDFKKYEAYYRDILKDYSPAELSYIDKFEIVPQNDIAASLLSLELKNKIILDDEIKITNASLENISSNERYVLDNIENGKITKFNEELFVAKVKEDALKNGLLKESKIELRKFKKLFLIIIPFIALLVVTCIIIFNDFLASTDNVTDLKIFILAFSILLIFFTPFAVISFFSTYVKKMRENMYIRTKKGEALNENLEGLKNYLKDFSNIDEKDEKSLKLWEDYLIYSVIFEQNTKVVKNIWNKYTEL